jgi:hypothetical protein
MNANDRNSGKLKEIFEKMYKNRQWSKKIEELQKIQGESKYYKEDPSDKCGFTYWAYLPEIGRGNVQVFNIDKEKNTISFSNNGEIKELQVNQLIEIFDNGEIVIKGNITQIDIEAEGFWIKESMQSCEDSFYWNEKYDGQTFFYLIDIDSIRFPISK